MVETVSNFQPINWSNYSNKVVDTLSANSPKFSLPIESSKPEPAIPEVISEAINDTKKAQAASSRPAYDSIGMVFDRYA